jgi:hypothetical protein
LGRFGKNLDLEKEVVSSMIGIQISIAVKCKTTKMVANLIVVEAKLQAIGRRKIWWDRPHGTSKQVGLGGSTKLWHGWRVIGEGVVWLTKLHNQGDLRWKV